jgi:hypothetical protein
VAASETGTHSARSGFLDRSQPRQWQQIKGPRHWGRGDPAVVWAWSPLPYLPVADLSGFGLSVVIRFGVVGDARVRIAGEVDEGVHVGIVRRGMVRRARLGVGGWLFVCGSHAVPPVGRCHRGGTCQWLYWRPRMHGLRSPLDCRGKSSAAGPLAGRRPGERAVADSGDRSRRTAAGDVLDSAVYLLVSNQ